MRNKIQHFAFLVSLPLAFIGCGKSFKPALVVEELSSEGSSITSITLPDQATTTTTVTTTTLRGNTTTTTITTTTVTTTTTLPGIPNGEALYSLHCASCHLSHPNPGSQKTNASLASINNGISNVSGMRGLSFLSQTQRQAISDFLRVDVMAEANFEVKATIGTRTHASSSFQDIFIDPNNVDNTALNIITQNILNQPGALGGPCSRYEDDCPGNRDTHVVTVAAGVNPLGDTTRKGYTSISCEEILSINRSVVTVLAKVGLAQSSGRNANNVQQLATVFFPGVALNSASVNALIGVASAAQAKAMNGLDQWRFVMTSMCKSSLLDIF